METENSQPGEANQAGSFTPSRPRAWVTRILCVVMIAAWILEMLDLVGVLQLDIIRRFAFIPALALFEPWRFVTAAFLHSYPQPFHLAFNCWALWVVGRELEPVLGRVRMLAAFLIFAVGGLLAQSLVVFLNPAAWITPVVGASGAVFGYFGMMLAIQRSLRIPAAQMAALIGINFVLGFLFPDIAWVAHLGGLLLGLALGFWTGHCLRVQARDGQYRRWLDISVYGALVALLLVANWAFYHFSYATAYAILGLQ